MADQKPVPRRPSDEPTGAEPRAVPADSPTVSSSEPAPALSFEAAERLRARLIRKFH